MSGGGGVYKNRRERTVDTATVRDETKILEFVHEVFQSSLHDVEQLRLDETLDDPVRVPVVCQVMSELAVEHAFRLAAHIVHGSGRQEPRRYGLGG